MSDTIHSHIILYDALVFSQDKPRVTQTSGKAKFLSSLALLLNGSETCTAVYIHQTKKTVFIARNEPIKPTDKEYFDQFFELIRKYAGVCFDQNKNTTTTEIDDLLRSTIFEYNSKKIVKRLLGEKNSVVDELRELAKLDSNAKRPLIDELRELSKLDSNGKQPFIDELKSNRQSYTVKPLRTEKTELMKKNLTEDDYVQLLFKILDLFLSYRDELVVKEANWNRRQLLPATHLAGMLYESRLFRYILDQFLKIPNRGEYYFEKTSAHERSINLFLKFLLVQKEHYVEIYKNVSWKIVPPIEVTRTLTVTPKEALENILAAMRQSDSSVSTALKEMKDEDFYGTHLLRINDFENHPYHPVHLHAEILLIDYLLKNGINETNNSTEVEIGISKMSCLPCSYYIKELNKKFNRYFCLLDSTHGKTYSNWDYRKDEDPSIINSINEQLIEQIKQWITEICSVSQRKGPQKSGDSDIMHTSLEADEFDTEQNSRWELFEKPV